MEQGRSRKPDKGEYDEWGNGVKPSTTRSYLDAALAVDVTNGCDHSFLLWSRAERVEFVLLRCLSIGLQPCGNNPKDTPCQKEKDACPSEEISRALLAHQNGLVKTTVIAPAKAETGAAQEVRCMYPFSAKANQLDKRSAVPPTNMEVRVPTGFFVVPLPSATERKKAYQ